MKYEYSDTSESGCSLLITTKEIKTLKTNTYSKASYSGGENVQCEYSLSKMEELIRNALEMNSELRMKLLICERKIVMLKMRPRPLKTKSCAKNDAPNHSTRGFLSQFMAPYFKDEKGRGCWRGIIQSPFEIPQLQCYGITQGNEYYRVALGMKEYLIDEISRKQYDLEVLKKKVLLAEDKDKLGPAMEAFRNAEQKIKALRKKNVRSLLGSDLDQQLDWLKVATYASVHGISAADCEGIWKVVLKPQYTFKDWTIERLQVLKEVAARYNFQCWDDIALKIGGGITGFLAFVHYRATFSSLLMTNGAWSKEEDSHLLRVVQASTIGKEILWTKVMYYVEDRSSLQCITRWYKINPATKRGHFTENEDALLLNCIDKFGCNFEKISSVLGNRSVVQVRDRFKALKNLMDEGTKSGGWSVEEDELLLRLVDKYGKSKWSQISKEMPSRNRVQIRQRYSLVLKKKVEGNAVFDLHSLQRRKRDKGTHARKETIKSLVKDDIIGSFIENKVATGNISVRTPVRPGRKSRAGTSK